MDAERRELERAAASALAGASADPQPWLRLARALEREGEVMEAWLRLAGAGLGALPEAQRLSSRLRAASAAATRGWAASTRGHSAPRILERLSIYDPGWRAAAALTGPIVALAASPSLEDVGARLRELPELRGLRLGGDAELGAEVLEALAPGRRLAALKLALRLDDAAFGALPALPRLERLDLSGARLKGPGLAALARLPRLRELRLVGVPVTDEALRWLAEAPGLERIDLWETALRGPGLLALEALPRLRELDLGATWIADDALPLIARLTGLERLSLKSTRISQEGKSALAGALPNCRLEVD